MRTDRAMAVMKAAAASIVAGALLLAVRPALASGIDSFSQRVEISPAGAITVREKVVVDFSEPRHGIYRDLPVHYRTQAGNPFSLKVTVASVAGPDGEPLPYEISRSGDYERVKIGDPDSTVSGRQEYDLTYTVSRALLFLKGSDELYWNAIVDPWNDLGLPAETSVAVALPAGADAGLVKTRCFTQVGSSEDGGCRGTANADGTVSFAAKGTPLTVVVDWPKGLVAAPTAGQLARDWFADNGIVLWPLLCLLGMFGLWNSKGRDPKPKAIVVQYAPADGVAPAEYGVLAHSAAGKEEVTATIVDLAVRGYLDINEKTEGSFFGQKATYSFTLKNPDRSGLKPFEERVHIGIFGAAVGQGAEVSLTELQYKFYNDSETAKQQVFQAVVARGWFARSPAAVRAIYFGLAFLYAFLVIFFGRGLVGLGPTWAVSLLLPTAIIAGFGYFMPARTAAGTEAYAAAKGFEEFLSKADKYRLEWQEKENVFEKYLPYAMVFNVVDKWAHAFEGALVQPPSWYHGGSFAAWTPVSFIGSLHAATDSFSATMFAAPSSRGGGGMGGGGIGGGGFGGGGGGSW